MTDQPQAGCISFDKRMLSPRLQTCLMRSRIAAAESATYAYSVCIHHTLSLVGTLKEALLYEIGVVSD